MKSRGKIAAAYARAAQCWLMEWINTEPTLHDRISVVLDTSDDRDDLGLSARRGLSLTNLLKTLNPTLTHQHRAAFLLSPPFRSRVSFSFR
jgi:hypothetical protein